MVRLLGDNSAALKALSETDAAVSKTAASGAALGNAGALAFGALGVGADLMLAKSVEAASGFQTLLSTIQHNTTLSADQTAQMGETIKRMSSESGASLDQLGAGYMHVTNLGFDAAKSTDILTAAMHSAVATGGNVADTANLLASVMKEYGSSNLSAAQTMDVLHEAAATGNLTLEQFVNASGKVMAMDAALGGSLTDVSAAFSTLTQHGENASQAAQNLQGELTHIVNPTKGAQEEIARLAQTTGIDLKRDFSEAGLQALGLGGIMADLSKVVAATGDESFILKLIPALRGGIGALSLATVGAADFAIHLQDLKNAEIAGTISSDAYAQQQGLLSNRLNVAEADVKLLGIAIGSALIPPMTDLMGIVTPVIKGMSDFAEEHPKLSAAMLTTVGVTGTLIGGLTAISLATRVLAPGMALLSGEFIKAADAALTDTAATTANVAAEVAAAGAARATTVAVEAETVAREGLAAAETETAVAGVAGLGLLAGPVGVLAAAGVALGAVLLSTTNAFGSESGAARANTGELDKNTKAVLDNKGARQEKDTSDPQVLAQKAQAYQTALAAFNAANDKFNADSAAAMKTSGHFDLTAEANSVNQLRNVLNAASSDLQGYEAATHHAEDASKILADAQQGAAGGIDAASQAAERADAANAQLESTLSRQTKTAAGQQEAFIQMNAAIKAVNAGGTDLKDFIDQLNDDLKSTDPITKAVAKSQQEWLDIIQNSSPQVAELNLAVESANRTYKSAESALQSATGSGQTYTEALHAIQDAEKAGVLSATDLQNAWLNLYTKPTPAQLALKAQIADITKEMDGLQAQLSNQTPALQHVAALQKIYDQALLTGATEKATDKAKTDLDTALAQTGPTGAAVAALQRHQDELLLDKDKLNDQSTALASARDAEKAHAEAARDSGAAAGEEAAGIQGAVNTVNAALPTMDSAVTESTRVLGLFEQAAQAVSRALAGMALAQGSVQSLVGGGISTFGSAGTVPGTQAGAAVPTGGASGSLPSFYTVRGGHLYNGAGVDLGSAGGLADTPTGGTGGAGGAVSPGFSSTVGAYLTADQLAAGLKAAGMDPALITTQVAILLAEHGQVGVANSIGATGIGQIMPGTGAMVGLDVNSVTGAGGATPEGLAAQFRAIAEIQRIQGFGAWDVYRAWYPGSGHAGPVDPGTGEIMATPGTGEYQARMPEARDAVARLGGDPAPGSAFDNLPPRAADNSPVPTEAASENDVSGVAANVQAITDKVQALESELAVLGATPEAFAGLDKQAKAFTDDMDPIPGLYQRVLDLSNQYIADVNSGTKSVAELGQEHLALNAAERDLNTALTEASRSGRELTDAQKTSTTEAANGYKLEGEAAEVNTGIIKQAKSDLTAASVAADQTQADSARTTAQAALQAALAAHQKVMDDIQNNVSPQQLAADEAVAESARKTAQQRYDYWHGAEEKFEQENAAFTAAQLQRDKDIAAAERTLTTDQQQQTDFLMGQVKVSATTVSQVVVDQAHQAAAAHRTIVAQSLAEERAADAQLLADRQANNTAAILSDQTRASAAHQSAQNALADQNRLDAAASASDTAERQQASDLAQFKITTGAGATDQHIASLERELAATQDVNKRKQISDQITALLHQNGQISAENAITDNARADYVKALNYGQVHYQTLLSLVALYNAQAVGIEGDAARAGIQILINQTQDEIRINDEKLARIVSDYKAQEQAAQDMYTGITHSAQDSAAAVGAASSAGGQGAGGQIPYSGLAAAGGGGTVILAAPDTLELVATLASAMAPLRPPPQAPVPAVTPPTAAAAAPAPAPATAAAAAPAPAAPSSTTINLIVGGATLSSVVATAYDAHAALNVPL